MKKSNIDVFKRSNKNSFVIEFPSRPFVGNDICISFEECAEAYDIIMKIFNMKYYYEQNHSKQNPLKKFDLNDLDTYQNIINVIDCRIHDPLTRTYLLETASLIRDNNFSKKSVKQTYKFINEFFSLNTFSGSLFKNNLAGAYSSKTGKISFNFIDFKSIFKKCNKETISPKSPEMNDVIKLFNEFKQEYEAMQK